MTLFDADGEEIPEDVAEPYRAMTSIRDRDADNQDDEPEPTTSTRHGTFKGRGYSHRRPEGRGRGRGQRKLPQWHGPLRPKPSATSWFPTHVEEAFAASVLRGARWLVTTSHNYNMNIPCV